MLTIFAVSRYKFFEHYIQTTSDSSEPSQSSITHMSSMMVWEKNRAGEWVTDRFDRKMSFHYSAVGPAVSDRAESYNGKHPMFTQDRFQTVPVRKSDPIGLMFTRDLSGTGPERIQTGPNTGAPSSRWEKTIELRNTTFAIRRVVLQGSRFIDFVWEIHFRYQNAKIKLWI